MSTGVVLGLEIFGDLVLFVAAIGLLVSLCTLVGNRVLK